MYLPHRSDSTIKLPYNWLTWMPNFIIDLVLIVYTCLCIINYPDASGNPVTQSIVSVTDASGNPVTGKL